MAERARGIGRKRSLIVALATLTAASAIAGAVTLALPAALGAAISDETRSVITVAAAAAVLYSAVRRRKRPWQRDVETPQRWLRRENLSVALLNGAALGTGVASRIGFWAWWLLPLFVFQTAQISMGLVTGAAYGATRLGASSVMTLYASRTQRDPLLAIGAKRRALDASGEALMFVGALLLLTVSIASLANR